MFGKGLNKKKTNAKGKNKNSIARRFEKDLKSEKKNDKQSNIARRLGKGGLERTLKEKRQTKQHCPWVWKGLKKIRTKTQGKQHRPEVFERT